MEVIPSCLFLKIEKTITNLPISEITAGRKTVLQPLVNYIQNNVTELKPIRLNLICTHNSRRSHLAQIWAQTVAAYFNIKNVFCYSGGTVATAMFPVVAKTLEKQGFAVKAIADGDNPVYAVKYGQNQHPIICFSKKYDDSFNPESEFAAILTCSQANSGCPYIAGADKRIPVTFDDPKAFDNTPQQAEKYEERSLQIASEMFYVFSLIKQ